MSIRTILLQMGLDEARHGRLGVAARLAAHHGAALDLLFLTASGGMPAAIAGRGASYAYTDEVADLAREKADDIRREAEAACQAVGVDPGWEVVDGDPIEILAERSRTADLVVVPQGDGATEEPVGLQRPDDLISGSACGVLVLPDAIAPDRPVGRRVMLAWKNSREAARAVRAGLAFLRGAEETLVLTVGHDGAPAPDVEALLRWLDRHGVRAAHVASPGEEIAGAILTTARDREADLVVMGAFGRSRFRETVTGSVTRDVLRHLSVPALLAH